MSISVDALNQAEILAEVESAFTAYETALVTNDVATLDALFFNHASTVRYGADENLYGFEAIAAFRAQRSIKGLKRQLARTQITTYGTDMAVTATLFYRQNSPELCGRQMQTWMRSEQGWKIVAAHVSQIPDQEV